MKIENRAALQFILQDDVYLLQSDKNAVAKAPVQPVPEIVAEPLSIPIAEPVVETPALKLNYLGQHKKAFLVIVHYPNHEFIADEHLIALESILKRKDHAIDDVAILNLATVAITDMDGLLNYFNPQKVLIMGKSAIPVNLEAPSLNQPKQIGNIMLLYSFSFDEMMSSTDNKKAFWDQMKSL